MEPKKGLDERISDIELSLNSLREALIRQNNIILSLGERIVNLSNDFNSDKSLFLHSTGNEGVNQSINNQSTNSKIPSPKNKDLRDIGQISDISTGNEGVKELLTHTNQTTHTPFFKLKGSKDQNSNELDGLKGIKSHLNNVFKAISRQELKTFLTIYQLEEEGVNPTYKAISRQMGLSEHCIRAHVCSLLKKSAPLEKTKLNNRLTLTFVKKDFKMLNLKEQLLTLYYKTDPEQTTLLDNSSLNSHL
jgi:hypothetical protein